MKGALLLVPLLLFDADPPARGFDPGNCGLLRTVAPLGGALNGVAFSPDGRRLAVGCAETVRVYETATWREVARLEGHPNQVLSVAFSPDGHLVAAGGFEGAIVIWDAVSGRVEKKLEGHTSYVPALAWSPDGRSILSGSLDASARLWETGTGKQLRAIGSHQAAVLAVAFSSDGRRAMTAGGNNVVKLWDATTWEEERAVAGEQKLLSAGAFSPDSRFACGTGDGDIRIRKLDGDVTEKLMEGHSASVARLAFMPDGRHLLSVSYDATVCIWTSRGDKTPLAKLRHNAEPFEGVAVHPTGRLFATIGQDRHLKVWGYVAGGMARVRSKGFCGIRVEQGAAGKIVIIEVIPGTPAAQAGLRGGDVLRKVGGAALATPTDSVDKIGSYLEGDEVEFELERDGRAQMFKIRLGRRPAGLDQ